MILIQKVAPELEPVSFAEAEGQIRLDLADESESIERFITATRELCESRTRRALITQQWELKLDSFPASRIPIELPQPPLQKVDSIKYIDAYGVEQTLDPGKYRIVTDSSPTAQPGLVLPVYGEVWPIALNDLGSVSIIFTCGYGPVSPSTELNVPASIKQWILLNVANLYEHRETIQVGNRISVVEISTLADGLLANYRITRL